ncbi:MAG: carbamoylphosphate synthase large subunit [Erysipelotrichaceae bacterium]|nr:carbamoylphosphate synthase large subunit [Erysipelotrichaceae bacterium]
MNVIFISPHFPLYYWNFCDRLKKRGVNVLGIGDASYDFISDECKQSLTEYYKVNSLEDFDEVYRAVAFFAYKYGKIDWIESENEYWLETEAALREEFNVTTGTKISDMACMKYKSKMKAVYEKAGIKACRYHMVNDYDGCLEFLNEVGYPVVVKPDNGVGAIATYKLRNKEEFDFFYMTKPDVQFVMEEFVPGHVETFDGITNSKKEILICSSHKMMVSIMDTVNEAADALFHSQKIEGMDLYEVGKRTVEAFDTRSRYFHFEFFRLDEDKPGLGKKGDLLGLEVNMRAPGAYMPDMLNWACDVDVYDMWAEMLVTDTTTRKYERKYSVGYAGRKKENHYKYNYDQIREMFHEHIMMDLDVPEVLAAAMGDHTFIFRAETEERMLEIMNTILER